MKLTAGQVEMRLEDECRCQERFVNRLRKSILENNYRWAVTTEIENKIGL